MKICKKKVHKKLLEGKMGLHILSQQQLKLIKMNRLVYVREINVQSPYPSQLPVAQVFLQSCLIVKGCLFIVSGAHRFNHFCEAQEYNILKKCSTFGSNIDTPILMGPN
ncbi:hypothetical protein ACJX0J_023004, partial [Zea mays]